jgi:hypothetical protein
MNCSRFVVIVVVEVSCSFSQAIVHAKRHSSPLLHLRWQALAMDGLVHRIAIAGTNSLSCFPPFNEDLF